MKKKILINLAIICIIFGGAFNGYAQVSLFSCSRIQLSVYAADNTSSWQSVSNDDLVTAFKYYCKSRNVAIEGSILDAVTQFTTTTFNNICNTLGISTDSLQAELKKVYSGAGYKFLFTHSGISLYNRIFAEFLQNNDLEVGDSVDDLSLFNGKFYNDGTNKSLIWVMPKVSNDSSGIFPLVHGSNYIYAGSDLVTLMSTNSYSSYDLQIPVIGINQNNSVYHTFYYYENAPNSSLRKVVKDYNTATNWAWGTIIYADYEKISDIYDGGIFLYTLPDSDKIYLGKYIDTTSLNNTFYWSNFANSSTVDTENVNITINNYNGDTINNNNYNKNYTIIYNDGDYYEDDGDEEPSPDTQPPGGGGGGGGNDPDPDEPPIVDPTPTPDPHIPEWDIELPEMPTGSEWLLYGMEKKFPWDIPYNLMFMLSLFAAEPETPHFEGTIDLKICEWNYDIDLAPFDNIARYVRDFEFIGFLIGLMLITRKLIWG